MATNALMNQAVRENRFLRPGEYSAPETWLDRLGRADTNPLVSAGLALLTTGQGSNPLATAFQSFTNAAKNKQAAAELDQQQADLINAEVALTRAPDYNTYQQALASYAALPGADKDLMSTTAAIQRERLTGVPIETGMVVDPSTGQQRYRDPIPFGIVLDQTKQLNAAGFDKFKQEEALRHANDKELEELRNNARLGELTLQQQQRMQELEATETRQAASSERIAERQALSQQQGDARSELKRVRPIYEGIKVQMMNVPQVDSAMAALTTIEPANLTKTVSEAIKGVYGTDVSNALSLARQGLQDQIIGSLPPGSASDADVSMAVNAALDQNQSIESMLKNWNRLKDQLAYKNAYYTDELSRHEGTLYQQPASRAQPGVTDSGASVSGVSRGWGVK